MALPKEYKGSKAYLLAYCELITAARYKGVTTYQKLATIMGLPDQGNLMGFEVGRLLGEIVDEEVKAGRPMLSAVVVNTRGKASEGFFSLARELGLFSGSTNEEKSAFLEKQKQAAYRAWEDR